MRITHEDAKRCKKVTVNNSPCNKSAVVKPLLKRKLKSEQQDVDFNSLHKFYSLNYVFEKALYNLKRRNIGMVRKIKG